MTAATATKQLYEVNLYCELTYPKYETEQECYEMGLCDYNLVFLTELDRSSSVDDFLKDATNRFPEEMDRFYRSIDGADCDFHCEWHYPQEDGIHMPEEDDFYVEDNECPYAEYAENCDD